MAEAAPVNAPVIRGTQNKITDQMIKTFEAEIGKEYPSKDQYNTEATLDNIKHWANGIGDLNPLWQDADYAKTTRYGGIIAIPTFLYSCCGRAGIQSFPGIHTMHLGDDWIFYKQVPLGTPIRVTGGVRPPPPPTRRPPSRGSKLLRRKGRSSSVGGV